LDIANPSVGILNVGKEESKGNDLVRSASLLLKSELPQMNYVGFVEGNDIAEGSVDVIVADGFSGNIALKTAEGTANLCKHFMKQSFEGSIWAKFVGLLAQDRLKKGFSKLNPMEYNGAMFLGLNGIVVKSHGCADYMGFANAIEVAINLVNRDINNQITKSLS
jgi:glycerol-3-phosphate acyltransferase PlsX